MSRISILAAALLASGSAAAQDARAEQASNEAAPAQMAKADEGAATPSASEAKTLSGISILGNQEAPKSLVIVPWKGSEMGDMPGLSRLLDDAVQPLDKDVFMRELFYYEIRSNP